VRSTYSRSMAMMAPVGGCGARAIRIGCLRFCVSHTLRAA
jgi:hypothetical protein